MAELTWAELADMHLWLGAARAAGGDAAEAQQMYCEAHPDRAEPEVSLFAAVDQRLRDTGLLRPEVLMDPLSVLPFEMALRVCSLLPAADVLSLAEVSVAWRGVARMAGVWTRLQLRTSSAPPALLRAAPRIRRLTVDAVPSEAQLQALEQNQEGELSQLVYICNERHKDYESAFIRILQRFSGCLELLFVKTIMPTMLRACAEMGTPKLLYFDIGSCFVEESTSFSSDLIDDIKDLMEQHEHPAEALCQRMVDHIGFYTVAWEDRGPLASSVQRISMASGGHLAVQAVTSLLQAHRYTLNTFAIRADVSPASILQLVEVLSTCPALSELIMQSTSHLSLLRDMPAIRRLTLFFSDHSSSSEDQLICLQKLPRSLERLDVRVGARKLAVRLVGCLVRHARARRLQRLRDLTLSMRSPDYVKDCIGALRNALPRVTVRTQHWDPFHWKGDPTELLHLMDVDMASWETVH